MLLRTIIVVVLVLLLGYGAKEAWPLLRGPQLVITSPTQKVKNSELSDTGFITISGVATHTTGVSVNGASVLTDQQGHFSTTLTLPRGGAILAITAIDRFGRSVTEHRTVFVP